MFRILIQVRSFFIQFTFKSLLIAGLVSGVYWPTAVQAQNQAKLQDFVIVANELFRDQDGDSIFLDGSVQIVYKDQHINADRAKIFLKSKKVELLGRVQIVTPRVTIRADQANLDYESNTGLLFNGFVKSGNVLFEGDLIEKTGENEYSVSKANYTTCTNCPSSWSFTGTQIRAEFGGYAYIKNSILRFASIPVFWLPYLVVPLKSDRQTGLLNPQLERSDLGGVAVAQPIFFVLSRSQDATYTLKNYEKRGPKSLLNYRYMLSENSYGELDSAWLRDLAFKNAERLNQFRSPDQKDSPINRWFYKYDHYMELPSGVVHRLQLNNASDLQYSSDFPNETKSNAEPALENRMSLSKSTERQYWSVDSSYYINTLQSNPLGGNNSAVHRFPELKWSQSQKYINDTNFVYSIDLDYLNLTRAGPSYDDLTEYTDPKTGNKIKTQTNSCNDFLFDKNKPECRNVYDGKFDKNIDFIRTGQRLDFKPAIYYPIKVNDKVEVVPKLIFRETHYRFLLPEDSDTYRRYARAEVLARTSFSHTYGDLENPSSNRYKHEILPEVTYSRTPWIESRKHPFWGSSNETEAPFSSQNQISDGDLSSPYGLQFDYNDRVYDRYLVTFGITQKLIEKIWKNGTPLYRQIVSLRLKQSYDGYQDGRNDPKKEPWSSLAAILDVRGEQFETSTAIYYFPYQKVTNTSSRIRLTNEKGQFFQISTTKNYEIVPGAEVNSASRTEDYTFRTGFESRYINLMGQFTYDANWINSERVSRIKSWAYITQFKPPGDCWLITFVHNQTQGTPGANFNINFEFSFDGQPKPPVAPDVLNGLTL